MPDFGGRTDPTPFIAAAYCIGIFLIAGYGLIQLRFRKKLRALEMALNEGDSPR
ncbi:MAG: hypothetical protein H7318_13470 [Oligoflexus sp.]|nr:hypothetical protein [Oligoflexus sp.]